MATPQELLSASSCFRCLTDGQLDVVAVSLLSDISLNGGGGGGGLVSLTTGVTGILPVANGGTGTSTGFTQGSVVFAGAAGVFNQDNANFFWDDTNNRLGIGTATPTSTLEVLGPSAFRYGFATGALKIGADLNSTTISVNVRKLGRITIPSYDGGAINTYLLGGDLQAGVNDIYFGGVAAGTQYAATGIHFFTGATQTTTGGTERLTIYNDGNVGIGIAIPLASLHIVPLTAPALLISPFGAAAGNTGEFRLRELVANGTSHTGFKAPDSIAASEIYVLPNAAPAANRFLQAGAVAGGVSALSWAQVSLTADVTGILPVANGGSGTSTAFTQGSVIFAGAAGVFTEDNANLFWDNTNNWLGIGTAVPVAKLSVQVNAIGTIATFLDVSANGLSYIYVGQSLSSGRSGALGFTDNSDATSGYCWFVVYGDDPSAGTGFIIKKGGNVGFGTVAPLAKVQVNTVAAATVGIIVKAAAAQSANLTEWQDSAATILSKFNSAGNLGVRMAATALTAYLHIAAGTTAASTAPIKLTTGTSMTAAEAGAVEFTTDDLFFTITTGTARKRLLMADATAGLTSGKMPIATTNGRLIDLTASAAYTPTNVTTDRSYDANATSTDELADVLGSVIADLQTKGILG